MYVILQYESRKVTNQIGRAATPAKQNQALYTMYCCLIAECKGNIRYPRQAMKCFIYGDRLAIQREKRILVNLT